jgi:hypothetical protein
MLYRCNAMQQTGASQGDGALLRQNVHRESIVLVSERKVNRDARSHSLHTDEFRLLQPYSLIVSPWL